MSNSSKSEAKVVELFHLQFGSNFYCSRIRYHPPVICVYQRRFEMTKKIVYVPELGLDEIIGVMQPLYGKYDKVRLVNNDLSNSFQFPAMKHDGYTELVTKEDESETIKVKIYFKGIQRSTLLNLRSLLVFGMTLAAMQCTKLLINGMHGGLLWLDKDTQFMQ